MDLPLKNCKIFDILSWFVIVQSFTQFSHMCVFNSSKYLRSQHEILQSETGHASSIAVTSQA